MRTTLHPNVHTALRRVTDAARVLSDLSVDDRSPGAVGVGIHYLMCVQSFTEEVQSTYGDDHPERVVQAFALISDIRNKVYATPLMTEALFYTETETPNDDSEPQEDESDAHRASDCFHDDNEY